MKNKMFLCCMLFLTFLLQTVFSSTFAQRTISGIVKDEKGEPMIGVNVVLKSIAGYGTTSDVDGNFLLKLPSQTGELQFMFIGYETQIVNVTNQTNLIVVMLLSTEVLDEVVVVGYGTQKKVNVTGAVAQVDSKALESRPITSVGAGLQGAIGNLNITTGGRPNATSTFNIRGTTSINGGSPLIMVDNVSVTEADVARLNPADIANVSVIKDASAAAIYGARAAFGVILITTKSGTNGKLKVDVNFNQSFRNMTRLPKYSYDPYVQVTYKDIMGVPWYDMYSDADIAYAEKVRDDPANNPAAIVNPADPNSWSYFGSTNWNDIVFKTAATSNVNINISQKTEKMAFYMSGEFLSQGGAIKMGDEKYRRANFRSKVDYNVTKWAKVTSNISYAEDKYTTPYYAKGEGYGSLFYHVNKTNVLFTPYNPDGTLTYYGSDIIGHLESGGRHVRKNSDIMLALGLDVSIIKDMWSVKADVTFRKQNITEKNSEWSQYYGAGPNDPHVLLDGGVVPWVEEISAPTYYNAINVYTNFNKSFKNHNLEVLLGFNQECNIYDYVSAKRDNLISTGIPSLGAATGDNQLVNGVSEDWAVRGVFYRLNYNYGGRYIAEVNGRYDGTSRFPKDDRFAFFPSFALGYVVSEEGFFEPLKSTVSQLKLRGSLGLLGNQNVGPYDYLPTMPNGVIGQIIGGSYPMGVYSPALISGNLTWEKVTTKNFGVDANFFNNRLTASFDIYRRDTEDMLVPGKTLPGVLGTSSPRVNCADLKTTGWEISASYRNEFPLFGKPFKIGVSAVLSNSKSIITKYNNPLGNLNDYYVGQEIGEMWGLTTDGFFNNQQEIDALDQTEVTGYLGVRPIEPGDLRFRDLNNDNKINKGSWTLDNHGDYRIIGNSAAKLPYSFTFNFDWYGFDLSMFFQGVGKKDYYAPAGQFTFWGVYAEPWTNVLESNMNHWTPQTPDAYFPRLKPYIAEKPYWDLGITQTRYMQDASYLRLRNLTLGYTIPQILTEKLGFTKLKVYLSGENLALWTNLSENLDPENLSGVNYPINKVFSFGVNVSF